jgi:hypothetical protein
LLFILFDKCAKKKYIKNILQNENGSNTEVLKVKKILISKYSWWAIGQGQLFKKKAQCQK